MYLHGICKLHAHGSGVGHIPFTCLCWICVLRLHDARVCRIVHVSIWCLSARLRPPLPAISSLTNRKWGPNMSRHVNSLASSSNFQCYPRLHLRPRPRPCLSCSRIHLTFRRLRGAQCSVTAIANYRSPTNSAVDQTTGGAQLNPTQYALHGELLDCLQALSGFSTVCLPDPRPQNTSRSQCRCLPRPSPPMLCATAIDLPPSSLIVSTPAVFHSQGLAHYTSVTLAAHGLGTMNVPDNHVCLVQFNLFHFLYYLLPSFPLHSSHSLLTSAHIRLPQITIILPRVTISVHLRPSFQA